ncbi:MAG: 2Fe-2S iron-sulfur cluster-binding protein [Anaerolineales bacterium]
MSDKVSLTIDGKKVEVEEGTTILKAAEHAGIEIPVLCYFAHTTANGLCRLCVVETEGVRGMQAACVAKVQQDSVVHTDSTAVQRARKTILEMLAYTVDLSEAPELKQMMERYGAKPERFEGGKTRQPDLIDDNPMYIRDYAKCVMCWRCVQVCAEDAQYTFAIDFSGRGFNSSIGTFFDKPIPQTTCVFCGQCVGVCPTGALKGKREFLFEQGVGPEDIFEITRRNGKSQRSVKGPHLDRGG